MDEIKPVAWADVSDVDCLAEYGWSPSELYSTKVMDFYVPLYSQQAIDTLRAEVERLTEDNGAYAEQQLQALGNFWDAKARAERAEAEAEALLRALRVAVLALAHASEADAKYFPSYQVVSAAIDAAKQAQP